MILVSKLHFIRFERRFPIKKIIMRVAFALFWVLLALGVPQEYPVPGAPSTLVSHAVGEQFYDFVEWLSTAWGEKAIQLAAPVQDFMADDRHSQIVLDYVQAVNDWGQLEWKVRQAYNDSTVTDPAAATTELRAQRDALRAQMEQRRPTVEAILQQQLSSVLRSEEHTSELQSR